MKKLYHYVRTDRLKMYKRALWRYQLAYFLEKTKLLKCFKMLESHTYDGFCYFFFTEMDEFIYGDKRFKEVFPELFTQKPKVITNQFNYWFKMGDKKPRIQALKNAILITKTGGL